MAIIYLIYQQHDDFAIDVKKVLQSFNHVVYDHSTIRDRIKEGTRDRRLPAEVDGTIIFPSTEHNSPVYYKLEIDEALSTSTDSKKIILLAPKGTNIPSHLIGYYTFFIEKNKNLREQLGELNPMILLNFGNLAIGFTNDYKNRVIREGAESRVWLLCVNDENWPMEAFQTGGSFEFNSRHRNGNTTTDLNYFRTVRTGDRMLVYAYGRANAVICQFRVYGISDLREDDDILLHLEVEFLIDPVVELNEIPINNLMTDPSGSKLYPLTPEAVEHMLASRQLITEGQYTISRRQDFFTQKNALTHISNDGASHELNDDLDIEDDVKAMAMVIAYREVQPPLSIGLFGNWGSGKSFFMHKLEQEISKLSTFNNDRFCREIVPIRFNSWHYSDANLWASLITRIFEGLENYGKKYPPSQLTTLYNNLHSTKELVEEATLKQAQVDKEISKLTERETEVRNEIKSKAIKLTELSYASLAKAVFANGTVQSDLACLKKEFDFIDTDTHEKLYTQTKELNSFAKQVRLIIKQAYFFNFGKGLAAIGLTGLIAAACYFSYAYVSYFKNWYEDIKVFVAGLLLIGTQVIIFIQPASRAIQKLGKGLRSLTGTIEKLQDEERNKHNTERELVKAELAAAKAAQNELRVQHEQLKSQQAQLELEIGDIRSGKKLVSFIESRVSDERYTNSLGIISWIRKDFEILDFLLKQQHELEDSTKQELEKIPNIFRIERIVLYIDDLDRCDPAIVVKVLEAIHLLLAFPLFVVVVGVDPRWMNKALNQRFDKILNPEIVLQGTEQPISSQAYLEKIFQIPFLLKPVSRTGISKLISGQFRKDSEMSVEQFKKVVSDNNFNVKTNGDILRVPHHGSVTEQQSQATTIGGIGNEPQVELLIISQEEIEFMQALGQMIGDTPRAIKRFINIYRIIRSHGDLVLRLSYQLEHYQAILLLLALLNNYKGDLTKFFGLIRQFEHDRHFWHFLDSLTATEFEALAEQLSNPEHPAYINLREAPMYCFTQNLDLVSRFSFKLS